MIESRDKSPSSDSNKHVREGLSDYIALPYQPYYAVLLNGSWGIGKTYLVKKFLREKFDKNGEEDGEENGRKYIYVSLYGLRSVDELDAALFQAAYPALKWKGTKIAGRVGKALLKFFRVDPEIIFADLSIPNADLYVFDDLERCEMSINESLGYVNQFVEHEGHKVVIVANEKEIKDKEEYAQRREKLIGKTLEVQSALDEALTFFIGLLDNPITKSLLEMKRADISTVYHQSGLNNLRILQRTIWDYSRFFAALSERHRKNDEAVASLLRSYFALSFEIKSGRLREEDLKSWFSSTMEYEILRHDRDENGNGDRERSRCEIAIDRYPDIDLSETFLPRKLIEDIFVKGIVEHLEIRACLDQSAHFADRGAEPCWYTVWHFTDRTEEEFTMAVAEMERQFLEGKFVQPGELLHVFGLRLLLAKMGVLKKKPATLVSEGKRYIDNLYYRRVLQPLQTGHTEDTLSWGGYGGLGIYERETAELRELSTYLEEKRKKAAVDKYPDDALVLLEEMRTDPNLYVRRVCLTNSNDNLYYRIPILSVIKPDHFVSLLLQQSPPNQALIVRSFKFRYEHGDLKDRLAPELPWLVKVHDKLLKKAKRMSPMSRYRLTRLIERFIAPFI